MGRPQVVAGCEAGGGGELRAGARGHRLGEGGLLLQELQGPGVDRGLPRQREHDGVHVEEQLEDQVREFMSEEHKAFYEMDGDRLHLSPILKWFADDFDAAGGRIVFVKKYLPKEKAARLWNQSQIKWLEYDRSLNEMKVKT